MLKVIVKYTIGVETNMQNELQKYTSDILISAVSSGEIMARLVFQYKARSKNATLGSLCRLAKIPSTGYLADILSGRRNLALKYLPGVTKAFSLTAVQQEYLETLLLFEKEKAGTQKRDVLTRKLEDLRKVLGMALNVTLELEAENIAFDLVVLSTLSLFSGPATTADIVGLFSAHLKSNVTHILEKLVEKKHLLQSHDGYLTLQNSRTIFNTSQNGYSHLKFISDSASSASTQVTQWYDKRLESIFASSIISINKTDFMSKIEALRTSAMELQTQIESDNPNELLAFNLQVYPLGIKKI